MQVSGERAAGQEERAMRWIIRGIGALLLIIVVMLGSLFLLPGDRIARIASDQLSRMTGRAGSITGAGGDRGRA